MKKCEWCKINEKMERYHDTEWGVPVFDDNKHFEYLMLEVMQCGLNWNIILQKREIFRQCFDNFDYKKIASYGDSDRARILSADGMIRSEKKIDAVIHNARAFEKIVSEFGSFGAYLWGFTDGKMYVYPEHAQKLVAQNSLSQRISADLRSRDMKFLGGITVYSHLQACGIINDHAPDCFRYSEVMRGMDVEYRSDDR